MIKSIACVDKNFAIGKNNSLLFNIKPDMEYFRNTTMNHIVVCGRNTLNSFPNSRPLKNRTTVLLCNENFEPDNCIVFHDFNKMLNYIKQISITEDIFIIGGGQLYVAMNDYCDEMLITKVDAEVSDATVFYPNLDKDPNVSCIKESDEFEYNGYKYKFCVYKRIKSK